jgi:hypothetical protein
MFASATKCSESDYNALIVPAVAAPATYATEKTDVTPLAGWNSASAINMVEYSRCAQRWTFPTRSIGSLSRLLHFRAVR